MILSILEIPDVNAFLTLWERGTQLEHSERYDVESFLENSKVCKAIVDEGGSPIAVFDIRDTPGDYIKNMRVKFHPSIDLIEKAESPDEIERLLDTAVYALGTIFATLIESLRDTKTKFKIYNDHPLILTLFVAFAKHLANLDVRYKTKKYGNWIEVTRD